MVEQGWGRIINIGGLAARRSSLSGLDAQRRRRGPDQEPRGRTRPARRERHRRASRPDHTEDPGDRRVAAARGFTRRRSKRVGAGISIGRIVTADEVAAVVAFLACPRSVALNGDAIIASGGTPGPIYYHRGAAILPFITPDDPAAVEAALSADAVTDPPVIA